MMKVLKKIIVILSVITLFMMPLCSCEKNTADTEDDRLKVVTTLFPQYDFSRLIGGDKISLTKLLSWGAESHTYDPSISDIAKVSGADIFIYTGESFEKWAASLCESAKGDSTVIVDLSEKVELLEGDIHNGHSDNLHTDYDAHIWTSPDNAKIMVQEILRAFCEINPENADYYTENANRLLLEIEKLDERLSYLSDIYDGRTLYFGGRFAFLYMFEKYGLKYESPYHGCGEQTEPSIKIINEIISDINSDGAKYIFAEEMSEGKIAKSIAEETGTKILVLHSCHNLSKEEAENGESFISVMNRNIDNLELAIKSE